MELTPQEKYAKILIRIESQDCLEKAIEIINNEGAQILCLKYATTDNVILDLNVADMRTIVLRLTENGFNSIEAINAIEQSTYGYVKQNQICTIS